MLKIVLKFTFLILKMTNNPILFLYLRRSDGDTNSDHQLETQKNNIQSHLKNFFKMNDEEISSIPFYKDMQIQGVTSLDQRPGFGEIMQKITKIRENDSDTPLYIIAYNQDRISRSDEILCELKKFVSNKCVKLHYAYYKGEIDPNMSNILNIVAKQERANTIIRTNAFYKAHKNDWGDPRVGFGWDFEPRSKEYPRGRKVPNPKEYPIFLKIKEMYENGDILTNISKTLNKRDSTKNNGKKWDTRTLKRVCKKNEMVWCKDINKDYFEDIIDNICILKIKDFKSFLKNNPQIQTSSDFWDFFKDTDNKICVKPYYKGIKVNKLMLKKYFEIDDESIFNIKLRKRIQFWLDEKEQYSLKELKAKIIEEFGNDNNKVKTWADVTFWEKIQEAKEY